MERVTAIYLACMFSIFLLFPGLGGYAQITGHKWILFLILSAAYILIALILRVQLALIGDQPLPSPRQLVKSLSAVQICIIAFWFFSVLSTLFSIDPALSFWGGSRRDGLLTITLYCAVFLLVSRCAALKGWFLTLFSIAISLNCLLALTQFAGWNPFSLYPQGMNYYDAGIRYAGEFLGTIGNVDLLSAVLCLAIPAFWIGIWKIRDKRRLLLLIPLALSLAVLLTAFVAGGVVGIAGSALLAIPVLAKGKRSRVILAIALALVLILGLLFVYAFGGRMGGFLYEASELLHGRWNDKFGSGRLYIWRNVWQLLPDRLLLGGGPDTLVLRTDAAFERYDESLGILIRSVIDNAHNEYLNVLVNQGLPALLCWLAALLCAAVQWIRSAPRHAGVAMCGGAVLGYCIQAFFGLSSPISTPFFWLALALLHAGASAKNTSHPTGGGRKP